MSPGPGMAEHRTHHQWQGERRTGVGRDARAYHLWLLGGKAGPASTKANMAPPHPKPHKLWALRKRESLGLAWNPLVSRKGRES